MTKKENHYYLMAGAIFTSKEPYWVTTVLGSCVAVCLYDTINHFGGINHFMLPYWSGQGLSSPRYGDIAISKLINEMESHGSKKNNLIAKLFGGASVLDYNHTSIAIGEKNVNVAKDILKEYNIRIVSESTGGLVGRKIIYKTATGEVYHKFLTNNTKTL